LLTNLTADVDSIKMFVSQAVVAIFSSLFIIIGASILLLTIKWQLALIVIAIIPIIGFTFFIVLRKVRVLFKKSREIIDWQDHGDVLRIGLDDGSLITCDFVVLGLGNHKGGHKARQLPHEVAKNRPHIGTDGHLYFGSDLRSRPARGR